MLHKNKLTEKKMSNKKVNVQKTAENTRKPKKNRFLLIFICIFMAIVLTVGLILGIGSYVKKQNAAVMYGSYMLDVGESNFFASRFKYTFISNLNDSGVDAYDVEDFWKLTSESGLTYGELLEKGFRDYISGILVANALFDRYSKLNDKDEEIIDSIIENALQKYGTEEEFNNASSKYGFDFDDYESAVEVLYKATVARNTIFGYDGSKLASFPSECIDFYTNNYSRVSLLFIRDETVVDTDAQGNIFERPMTDIEKENRRQYTEALTAAITNAQNDLDGPRITLDMYKYYYEKSDSDMERYRSYYFSENSAPTVEFREVFPEVVDKALSMKKGEYAIVDTEIGTCFIYKEELAEMGYKDKDNPFFSDFFSRAVSPIYSDMLALYAPDVEFSDKYSEVDIVALPKNKEFSVSIPQ